MLGTYTGIEDQPWLAGHWAPAAGRSPATVAEQLGDPATLRYQGGHGSFVIGTILQHAPGAEVIVDRLDDSMGCIDDWQLHTRLSALLDRTNRLDVLNLSLGGYTADNRPMPGVCTVLDGALDANPDLVVVASAGNDGLDRFRGRPRCRGSSGSEPPLSPPPAPRSGGRRATSASGSTPGAWARICPARSCASRAGPEPPLGYLDPGPVAAVGSYAEPERFDGWAIWTGTSFSAARVSGAIAAELKRDGRSPRQVVFDLVGNAATGFESGGLVEPATFEPSRTAGRPYFRSGGRMGSAAKARWPPRPRVGGPAVSTARAQVRSIGPSGASRDHPPGYVTARGRHRVLPSPPTISGWTRW